MTRTPSRRLTATLLGTAVVAAGAVVLSLALTSGGSSAVPASDRGQPGGRPTPSRGSVAAAPGSVSDRPVASSSDAGPAASALAGHAEPVSAGSRPVRVQIPAIGVDSSLQALGTERDGALETPSHWQEAGWYADGVRPGQVGPAVIAGHIDSYKGPAVFYKLSKLRPDEKVYVTDADHSRLTFSVDSTARYPKRTFPTEAVYGPSSLPLLRLVTCTGDFDPTTKSYLDNLVVTTHLVTS